MAAVVVDAVGHVAMAGHKQLCSAMLWSALAHRLHACIPAVPARVLVWN